MNEPRSHPEEERFSASVSSPLGPLLVVIREHAVVGLYHEDHDPPPKPVLLGRTLEPVTSTGSGRALRSSHHQDDSPSRGPIGDEQSLQIPDRAADLFSRTALQVEEYFAGIRKSSDLPTASTGTPFQLRVWAALADIPYGERRTYGDIAVALGDPSMGRAVGAAVRANPLSIIVPGHRVVSRNGGVIGYAAGTATKEALLQLESGQIPARTKESRGGGPRRSIGGGN